MATQLDTAIAAAKSELSRAATPPADRPITAYNYCPTCGLITIQAKYCPYCGPELQHMPAQRKCRHCNEQVTFAGSKFCGWCAQPLE